MVSADVYSPRPRGRGFDSRDRRSFCSDFFSEDLDYAVEVFFYADTSTIANTSAIVDMSIRYTTTGTRDDEHP